MKLRYTPQAIEDLIRLREFIADKNPVAAQRTAAALVAGIEKLKVFPKIGVQVLRAPQPDSIRDLFIGSYTARYLTTADEIVILRLWHNKESERGV
jgi:plasmid stabilization system protein ParE